MSITISEVSGAVSFVVNVNGVEVAEADANVLLSSLSSGTEYIISAKAVYDAGSSEFGLSETVHTGEWKKNYITIIFL